MVEEPAVNPDRIIEDGVSELYRGFYWLRKAERYQEEYDNMGIIIDMLTRDRAHLRKYYGVQ